MSKLACMQKAICLVIQVRIDTAGIRRKTRIMECLEIWTVLYYPLLFSLGLFKVQLILIAPVAAFFLLDGFQRHYMTGHEFTPTCVIRPKTE